MGVDYKLPLDSYDNKNESRLPQSLSQELVLFFRKALQILSPHHLIHLGGVAQRLRSTLSWT